MIEPLFHILILTIVGIVFLQLSPEIVGQVIDRAIDKNMSMTYDFQGAVSRRIGEICRHISSIK